MRTTFALILGLVLAGCGREATPNAPTAGADLSTLGSRAFAATTSKGKLDDLWPNDDGHAWSYDLRYNSSPYEPGFPTLYPSPEQVPPAPSPEDVVPFLGQTLPTGTLQQALYGLTFNGTITTESGASGQNLVETAVMSKGLRIQSLPSFRARLLARIARARRDFSGTMRALDDTIPPEVYFTPLLLHGGAWEKTAEYIGGYGDLDRDLAWIYLKSDTHQGATFRIQLLKGLADDVYLTGWIVPNRLRDKDSRGHAVQVIYVIDYGISQATDPGGALVGYLKAVTYGSVTYVPGTGPVASVERFAVSDDLGHPVDEISTSLRTSGSPLASR